jgi:superfamily II DNA or RNA helicase
VPSALVPHNTTPAATAIVMPAIPPARSAAPAGKTLIPFAPEDLSRFFDGGTIQRARSLLLAGAVRLVGLDGRIEALVMEGGRAFQTSVTPVETRQHLMFERRCQCGRLACAHMAAAALLVLDERPEWRRPVQTSFLDRLAGAQPPLQPTAPSAPPPPAAPNPAAPNPAAPRSTATWRLEPGQEDVACFVTGFLATVHIASDTPPDIRPASPREIAARVARDSDGDLDRSIVRLLGDSAQVRTPVPRNRLDAVDRILKRLAATGRLEWRDGTRLRIGVLRRFQGTRDPTTRRIRPEGMPRDGALLRGSHFWYVDPPAGLIGPAELRVVQASPPPPRRPAPPDRHARDLGRAAAVLQQQEAATIVERKPRPIARLTSIKTLSDGMLDIMRVSFDYGDEGRPAEIEAGDHRQFARLDTEDGGTLFARRDKALEQAALDSLRDHGFIQIQLDPPQGSTAQKGPRAFAFRGEDAAERWHAFTVQRLPILESEGWRIEIDRALATRTVEYQGDIAVAVSDSGDGWFDLDVGIEIGGEMRSLLPILIRLVEGGGMAAASIVDGKLQTRLDDGRLLILPADRIARVMSVLEAMIDRSRHEADRLRVPLDEADALLDIEDILARRPDETARIDAYLTRLRAEPEPLPEAEVPATFRGELRHYQRQGLAWMQRLRAGGFNGILADDMGLGKTAQTIAHMLREEAEGRLVAPCLVVVPTSLVPNWVNEAGRFAPRLEIVVLHGLKRHERRDDIAGAQLVITTYSVLARDIDWMRTIHWHLIVLDESQAIKNPEAKATRAVYELQANHRLCLSGTPVENNLMELWSQFAFLMPGLLGDRRSFHKRFRAPIEKRGDAQAAASLSRRIRPFLLRRTKTEVATELPPKTEIIRRIELEPAQRDLYESIRLSMHDRVRDAIASAGLARSAITVLDALLKLRQACCDPRLVKLPGARDVQESAKLACLVDMLQEIAEEGRRVLVFSQFTSMLDLIKEELARHAIDYVELTGSTQDRATPVERFQRGEVPVFLISLKAGGRGLNLTAADTVIHYDPWWNPAAEDQATDRAYRIGQDKPVFVYKLIAAGTVEERILELQSQKENLASATIEGTSLVGALRQSDIEHLFGGAEDEE